MEPTSPETRRKVGHWITEGVELFPNLLALIHGDQAAFARTVELEQECERLRQATIELRRELNELKREHDRLRMDRDEVVQAFAKLMDSVQPMNQIARKLGVKRSPFEREPKAQVAGLPPNVRPS